MIRPPPILPYWPAYPEPERSELEAAYRVEQEKWRRDFVLFGGLDIAFSLIGPTVIICAAWAIWLIWG